MAVASKTRYFAVNKNKSNFKKHARTNFDKSRFPDLTPNRSEVCSVISVCPLWLQNRDMASLGVPLWASAVASVCQP